MISQDIITADGHRYPTVLEPAEEGGFVVTCPTLRRGVVTEGETLEEAHAMALDALEGYLDVIRMDGRPIPPSDDPEQQPTSERVVAKLARA